MELDWITVTAQIVNFLILIWLLKRFLYGPIVNAMDRREQRIAARLDEAAEREAEAESQAARHREQTKELEHRREEILAEAKEEAEREKRRLVDEARTEVSGIRAGWQRQVEQERQEFMSRLRREMGEAVEAIARRALRDLANAELEERVVDEFVERLRELDKDTRKRLAGASAHVRSAFELGSTVRARITRAVHEQIGRDVAVEYGVDAALVCGIELTSAGRRVGWSLDDYLDELEARFEEAFRPVAREEEGA